MNSIPSGNIVIIIPEVPIIHTDFEEMIGIRRWDSWRMFTGSEFCDRLNENYTWGNLCIVNTSSGFWYAFQIEPHILSKWCYVKCAQNIEQELDDITDAVNNKLNIYTHFEITWL